MYEEKDGRKHYMLCAKCESHLGHGERYLSLLARGTAADLSKIGITVSWGPTLNNVDFRLVMRGILGILYKCHFAPSVPYTDIRLDRTLLLRLRSRILEDDYPTESLYLLAIRWLSYRDSVFNPKALVLAELTNFGSAKIFDLLMGGWSWSVFLSSPGQAKREEVWRHILRPNEPWRIVQGEIKRHRYFDDGKGSYKDEWENLDSNAPCPCGLREKPFSACCREIWCSQQEPSRRLRLVGE